jgi:hypothetical protein
MLTTTVEAVTKLGRDDRHALFTLFRRYYDSVSFERFDRDLSNKDSVFLMRDPDGCIRGFSTLVVMNGTYEGATIKVVFSGDTVIDKSHWGSPSFAFAWIERIGALASQAPEIPLYWLLIVKGHRTYRYLPTFGVDFIPDWRKPIDLRLAGIRDSLASDRFGVAYDREAGVVRFATSQGHLAREWACISDRERKRPDVRFFLERNPGYVMGEELVCLCELKRDNMRPLTRRLFDRGRGR